MKASSTLPIIFTLLLSTFMVHKATAQGDEKIPVLIVDGFSNHDWRQTTLVTQWILEQSGLFDIHVSTIPTDSLERAAWLPDFKKYGVVIQNTNNIWAPNMRWPVAAERSLETYVANGGGLYILHSGNNAFAHWPAYDDMIGLGWRNKETGYALEIGGDGNLIRIPPGEGEGTGHGERFNALIQILTKHPINEGYPDQWQTANTEVYFYPRGAAKNITVLSYAYDSTATKRLWPTEWVVSYGKGRVYNSTLGHLWKGETYPPAYRCVGFQTTVARAAEWLATGSVSIPVPANFPSPQTISLQDEAGFISTFKNQDH